MKEIHYVIFDGTSAYVGDLQDLVSNDENECIGEYLDIEEAFTKCDEENFKIES